MPKVKHVSDFMVDVCQDRENCIGRLCRYLESELNGINARVVGSPIIMTDGNSDEMLHVTIPYLPNSGSGKIAVKYSFTECNGGYHIALQLFDFETISSDYPISVQLINHGDSDSHSRHILAIWTETTEKRSSLTSEEIATFTKSAKANNKFAK